MALNRLPPALPIGAYRTYNIATPLSTHWTAATCAQVDCEHYLHGWAVRVEHTAPADVHLAKTAGRKYIEQHVAEGENYLVFEPGQPCFRAGTHMRRLDREEIYGIRSGDWRGDPTHRGLQLVSSQAWVDDSGENQQRLTDLIEKHA